MTTAVRVFSADYVCPTGVNTCHRCRAVGGVSTAVRPPSACLDCAGSFTDYPTLAAAMAAHPEVPWWQLPAVLGEDPEPELVAAMAVHLATIPPCDP